jgi:transposase
MSEGEVRILRADRRQLQWDLVDLEGLLAVDHRARLVWAFVERLDLRPFYDGIKAREGVAGRPAADPAVLVALWLYATLEGVGSARELERLCRGEVAYRWLCGGVPVNYHGLSDFRVGHEELLDRLLSESVATLMAEGLVSLDEVMIDGTKVKASAGKGSFLGEKALARAERFAGERIRRLKGELDSDPGAGVRRRQAAQERAARELKDRASRALAALERLKAEKAERAKSHGKAEAKKGEPKASLSDPEARFMRFADGARRPAYNMQIAATREGLVVALKESDRRNDAGLAGLMVDDIHRRYGQGPKAILVDTRYATAEDIVALAGRKQGPVLVYSPLPDDRQDVKPETLKRRTATRRKEHHALEEWRRRMTSPAAAPVYKARRRIELVNAHFKNRGFGSLTLRGGLKARLVGLWHALAHNILVADRLRTLPAPS